VLSYAKIRMQKKYAVFAFLIIIEAAFAVVCISHSSLKPYLSFYQSQSLAALPPENQLAGLAYYRYDPNTNRLCFAASAGMLSAEDAPLGIFKTAAARIIKVKDLQLHFNEPSGSPALATLQSNFLPGAPAAGKNGFQEILGQLTDARGHRGIDSSRWGTDMDLSNAREITIDDFDCGIFDENDLRLRVQSSRAIVNSDWPLVTLRGHVVITSADGSILESNYVKWDTKKQSFIADRMYVLRRGDSRITGKGICVDSYLNITNVKNVKF
jgi:Lipopolysaccharide-assembly, LptC-related